MRQAAKRDSVEQDIIDALRQLGATVQPLSAKGVPDLLIGIRGRNLLGEVKSGKRGTLTPDQVEWHGNWRGAPVVILRSVDDAIALVNELVLNE